MKFLTALLCVSFPWMALSSGAEEPSDAGKEQKPRRAETMPTANGLTFKMWHIPFQHGPSFPSGPAPDEVPESNALVDLRAWLQSASSETIHFAPGEEALFNEWLRILTVRAKPETIALVDALASAHWNLDAVRTLRVEVSLVEFSAAKRPEFNGNTSVESLRQAAGHSWHIINRMEVVTPDRRFGTAISKTGAPKEKPAVPSLGKDSAASEGSSLVLRPGEFGASLGVEPSFQENGGMIEANLLYRFRMPGPPAWNWNTFATALVKDGKPVLLRLDSAAPKKGRSHHPKLRGLILRVDVVYPQPVEPHRESDPTGAYLRWMLQEAFLGGASTSKNAVILSVAKGVLRPERSRKISNSMCFPHVSSQGINPKAGLSKRHSSLTPAPQALRQHHRWRNRNSYRK